MKGSSNGTKMSELQMQMSFRTWILFFVGDPFTPQRVLEKLQLMEDGNLS